MPVDKIDDFPTALVVWNLLGSCFGAAVRVAIGHDRGEPQSLSKIFATFASGTVIAVTSSQLIAHNLGFIDPSTANIAAVAISFPIGLLGLGFVYQLLDGKIRIPFLTPLPAQEQPKSKETEK